jgi:hypothetical protein
MLEDVRPSPKSVPNLPKRSPKHREANKSVGAPIGFGSDPKLVHLTNSLVPKQLDDQNSGNVETVGARPVIARHSESHDTRMVRVAQPVQLAGAVAGRLRKRATTIAICCGPAVYWPENEHPIREDLGPTMQGDEGNQEALRRQERA